MYNLTLLTNATDIGGLLNAANIYSAGAAHSPILYSGTLIVIFFIILIGLKRYEFKDSFLAASFVCSVLGGFFWGLGVINPLIELGFIVFTGVGYLMHLFDTQG